MALLGVSNLTKAFGTDLLFEGVSFEVQANDKIGVVGVNGSGKTTLFKMITGEMRPDDGELYQSKQAVVGYGRAEKAQVMDMVKRICALPSVPRPDDAADAIALAICHARSLTSLLYKGDNEECSTI